MNCGDSGLVACLIGCLVVGAVDGSRFNQPWFCSLDSWKMWMEVSKIMAFCFLFLIPVDRWSTSFDGRHVSGQGTVQRGCRMECSNHKLL